MDPHGKFLPPVTEEEFLSRSKDVQLPAATSILDTLKARRGEVVRNLDLEIEFYEKVIQYRKEGKL
jgi:hypothetical protein